MVKKYTFVVCLLFLGVLLPAQQLTRFAVVDLSRVYMSFLRDSRAVREWEEARDQVQREVDRRNREIQDLQSRKVNAELQGNDAAALDLENQIYRRTEALREYYQVKTAELEDWKNRLSQSDSFLEQVYDEIRFIAESEGYSTVLSLKENSGVLWYSPTVDITDKLIQNLIAKAGR
ncbi:MAG: OmpH family outer membrane protein [Treponema sp.]|jgi:outer membrane protein|nr:OmpH family outer membrane protein [Treponema sp.]